MHPEGSDNPASSQSSSRAATAARVNGAPLSVRAIRRTSQVLDRLRAAFGLHRSTVVDGVRYTETGAETLRRALSRRGTGSKQFIAEFGHGERQEIHCTGWRIYADLMDPRLLPCYEMTLQCLRPGMRALDFGCGTGYGASWLLDAVGPSGAVVAVDRDQESIRYAQRRYAAPNAAFELGWLGSLAGEIDGAFDLVVSLDAIRDGDDERAVIAELWRVLKPGGWMLIVAPVPLGPGHSRGGDPARTFESRELVALVKGACDAEAKAKSHEGSPAAPAKWDEQAPESTPGSAGPAGSAGSAGPASAPPPAPPAPEPVSSAAIQDHAGVLVCKPIR